MKIFNMKSAAVAMLTSFFTLLIGVTFQNCSPTGFAKTAKIVDAACSSTDNCASAASVSTAATTATTATTATANTVTTTRSSLGTATSETTLLYNFVASDQMTCEHSITDRFGKIGTCSLNGGCGVSCGVPGADCTTANPGLWGACVDINRLPASTATEVLTYNFVGPDKLSCEDSVLNRLNKNVNCSIGGGCGISCGAPGPSCPSANPNMWGVCITQ